LLLFCADGIKPKDVDLRPDMPYFMANASHRRPKITYLHIYECEKFSVSNCTHINFLYDDLTRKGK
jgi:cysteamine dioxygenase